MYIRDLTIYFYFIITHTLGPYPGKFPFPDQPVWYSDTDPQGRGATNRNMFLLSTYYAVNCGESLLCMEFLDLSTREENRFSQVTFEDKVT